MSETVSLETVPLFVLCKSVNCARVASHMMLWPGYDWSPVCPECLARAEEVAKVMGFKVATTTWATHREGLLVDDGKKRLKNAPA